jgi:hypothetical protein
MIWLFVALYAIVALIVVRPLAGHFAWDWAQRDAHGKKRRYPGLYEYLDPDAPPGPEWWVFAGTIAILVAAIWPILLVFARSPIKIGAERTAEKRQMAARIRELEKEAGL